MYPIRTFGEGVPVGSLRILSIFLTALLVCVGCGGDQESFAKEDEQASTASEETQQEATGDTTGGTPGASGGETTGG
ncbi:MAG: hypothetical protein H0X71_02955, partial [Rubrobacter sp.]|nr:hypothetical protein [Rubrobacter sp.]